MPESFGARLRRQRERQDIDLIAIAEQTKIKLSLLEALERDDVSHWPSGIFRRAFIRAYAHAIGLNPDVVVREFLEVHPDPIELVAPAAAIASAADAARMSAGPPTRLRFLIGSAIGSLSRLRRSPAVNGLRVACTDDDRVGLRVNRPFGIVPCAGPDDQSPVLANDTATTGNVSGSPGSTLNSSVVICQALGGPPSSPW